MTERPSGASEPAEALATALEQHARRGAHLLVGYSGGRDSSLLLALAAENWPKRRLRAMHVDHGWHPDSAEWARRCRTRVRELGVRCDIAAVDAQPKNGEGREAAARSARYGAFAERLGPGDVLLTAHHREDQAESLLLALLRGGGVHGWAGMPECRELGSGVHVRPWLGVSREVIAAQAQTRGLGWLDDPANADSSYDRVWLRREILPALAERWPEVESTLARAAEQAGAAAEAVDTLAARDYVFCRGRIDGTLDRAALAELPLRRQRALLRWWIVRAGLPRPAAARLEEARRQLLEADPERTPCIDWPGGEVRGWNGLAWATPPTPPVAPEAVFPWPDRSRPLDLPGRRLQPHTLAQLGIDPSADAQVEVRFRRGGERFRPAGAPREEPLKELLRRAGLPPWERDRIPLIYVDGELVAVVGLGRGVS
ncbi:MAG: tRNA lysidine(34) synthetase TilS [Halofilum sp. (in: g-proteobacteria)]